MEPHTKHGPLVTKEQAAKLLNVSIHTVDKWVFEKRLTSFKFGHQKQAGVRLRLQDVEAYMDAHLVPAAEDKGGR